MADGPECRIAHHGGLAGHWQQANIAKDVGARADRRMHYTRAWHFMAAKETAL